METIAGRKYAIIEKVMHLSEEDLTELETSLIKLSEEPISIEQYNLQMEEAEAGIDRGEFYSQDDVEKMSKKW